MPIFHHAGFNVFSDRGVGFVFEGVFGSPDPGLPGRFGGYCITLNNVGFGHKSIAKLLNGGNGWCFGWAYKPITDPAGAFGDPGKPIFFLESGGDRMFELRIRADKRLDVWTPIGAHESAASLNYGEWNYIEVEYQVGGNVRVFVNDTLDTDLSISTNVLKPLDRVTWYWNTFGQQGQCIDDLYCCNGSSASAERLGPVRIGSFLPDTDEITGFGRVGASRNAWCVNDHFPVRDSPDYDNTFVQVTIPDQKDLYGLLKQNDCTGRILYAATNIVAKAPSGELSTVQTIVRANPTVAEVATVGPERTLTASYQYWAAYSAAPSTFPYWREGDLENGLWGFRSGGEGIVRVTTFWVDKIQSLRNTPYQCGQLGSYAYGR